MNWHQALAEVRARKHAAREAGWNVAEAHWREMEDHLALCGPHDDAHGVEYLIDPPHDDVQAAMRVKRPMTSSSDTLYLLGDQTVDGLARERLRQRAAADIARTRPLLKRMEDKL